MVRYIELNAHGNTKVAFKIESIREVLEVPTGGCLVNGFSVKESYAEVIKFMDDLTDRRVLCTLDEDFRIKHLLREGIWRIFMAHGSNTLEYLQNVLACKTETELYEPR